MATTRLIRQFERAVYAWGGVARDKGSAYGEHTYEAEGNVFAYFDRDENLVLYRTLPAEREELAEAFGAAPSERHALHWIVPVGERTLPDVLPYVRRCYERALAGTNYSE